MKHTQWFLVMLLLIGSMACNTDNAFPVDPPISQDFMHPDTPATPTDSANRIQVRVGTRTFTATLWNTPAAIAFKDRLPLTLSMQELNGNEKFVDLPRSLPSNPANPGTIQSGDLMLYGSNTLVLFYETFRTSYSYTRLGRIDNPEGLAAVLGTGTITISFER